MTIQEALAELGLERVKKGMKSFDYPPDHHWNQCFLGVIYGDFGVLWSKIQME